MTGKSDAQCSSFSIRSTWVRIIRLQQYRFKPNPSSASLFPPRFESAWFAERETGANEPFRVTRFEQLEKAGPAVSDDLAATGSREATSAAF